MEIPFKLESDLERKITNDPEWKDGANWGDPRPGHPEGKIIFHIREVLENIHKLKVSKIIREKLRIIAIIHDTFKYKVDYEKPREGENHHATIARRFAEKYIQEEEVLDIIELHDEAYNCWQKGNRDGKWDSAIARADKLIVKLMNIWSFKKSRSYLELYLLFYKCDNETGDKGQESLNWFTQRATELASFKSVKVGQKEIFTQEKMFEIIKKMKKEKILPLKELLSSIPTDAYHLIKNIGYGWRGREYVIYRKGFEIEIDVPLGEKIVYVENKVEYIFEVPNVTVPYGRDYCGPLSYDLQRISGMVVFDICKLKYDRKTRTVSINKDFSPLTDVKIVDVLRPHGWGETDENGFPLRLKKSNEKNPKAYYMWTLETKDFEQGSTGYHGSVYRKIDFDDWKEIDATYGWKNEAGIATKKFTKLF